MFLLIAKELLYLASFTLHNFSFFFAFVINMLIWKFFPDFCYFEIFQLCSQTEIFLTWFRWQTIKNRQSVLWQKASKWGLPRGSYHKRLLFVVEFIFWRRVSPTETWFSYFLEITKPNSLQSSCHDTIFQFAEIWI